MSEEQPGQGPSQLPWRWTGSVGAVVGLLTGLVLAQLLAAGGFHWIGRDFAHPLWEIAGPILALVGAGGGYLAFAAVFGDRLLPSLVTGGAALAVLGALCAAVGFPWQSF